MIEGHDGVLLGCLLERVQNMRMVLLMDRGLLSELNADDARIAHPGG